MLAPSVRVISTVSPQSGSKTPIWWRSKYKQTNRMGVHQQMSDITVVTSSLFFYSLWFRAGWNSHLWLAGSISTTSSFETLTIFNIRLSNQKSQKAWYVSFNRIDSLLVLVFPWDLLTIWKKPNMAFKDNICSFKSSAPGVSHHALGWLGSPQHLSFIEREWGRREYLSQSNSVECLSCLTSCYPSVCESVWVNCPNHKHYGPGKKNIILHFLAVQYGSYTMITYHTETTSVWLEASV